MARIKEFKDYYKILNISDSANQEEIKKSFRKLALELHPDHNPNNPYSEEVFKEITEAYGVLSDPKKKWNTIVSEPIISQDGVPLGFNIPKKIFSPVCFKVKMLVICLKNSTANLVVRVSDRETIFLKRFFLVGL